MRGGSIVATRYVVRGLFQGGEREEEGGAASVAAAAAAIFVTDVDDAANGLPAAAALAVAADKLIRNEGRFGPSSLILLVLGLLDILLMDVGYHQSSHS